MMKGDFQFLRPAECFAEPRAFMCGKCFAGLIHLLSQPFCLRREILMRMHINPLAQQRIAYGMEPLLRTPCPVHPLGRERRGDDIQKTPALRDFKHALTERFDLGPVEIILRGIDAAKREGLFKICDLLVCKRVEHSDQPAFLADGSGPSGGI